MKRLIAVFAVITIFIIAFSALCPAFAVESKYAVEEADDDLFRLMQTGEFSEIMGYILIVLLGYVMPLFLIVFGLIMLLKSRSAHRKAWLVMPSVGLLTAILMTIFLILTA